MNSIISKRFLSLIALWTTTVVLGYASVYAWNGLTASTWDSLTAVKWNELVDKVSWVHTDSSGNVWIGIEWPTQKLHVSWSKVGTLSLLKLHNIDSWNNQVEMEFGNAWQSSYIWSHRMSANAWADLYFSTNDSSWVKTEQIRVTEAGRVGIWTTSPWEKLEVVWNVKITWSMEVADSMWIGRSKPTTYQLSVLSKQAWASWDADYQRGIFSGVNIDSSLWNNSLSKHYATWIVASVLWKSWFGTETLDRATGIQIQYGNYSDSVGTITDAYWLYVTPYRLGWTIWDQYDVYLAPVSWSAVLTGKHYWIYQANSWDNYFNGNVWIWTIAPSEKLEVDGNIKVTGLVWSGNWYACIDLNGKLYRSATACN